MKASLRLVLPVALGLHLLLAGCVPSVSDETKKLDVFKPLPTVPAFVDTFTIGGISFTEAPSTTGWTPAQLAAGPYFDPFLAGWRDLTTFPEAAIIGGARGGSPGNNDFDELAIVGVTNLPDLLDAAPKDYPANFTRLDGTAFVEYLRPLDNVFCLSESGTVSVTKFGGVGETIIGTFTVDKWEDIGGPLCTIVVPVTGSFNLTREIDNKTGNDGSGNDTISVTEYNSGGAVTFSHTYTESTQSLNNPLMTGFFQEVWDSYLEQIVSKFTLVFSGDGDRTTGAYGRDYQLGYYSVTGPGAYAKVGNDGLDLRLGNSLSSCSGSVGPLNITSMGPVGGKITGDFLSDAPGFLPPGCPYKFAGTFSVTREADLHLNVPAPTGDTLTLGSHTIAERKGDAPFVGALVSLTDALENVFVHASRFSVVTGASEFITISAYNPAAIVQSAPHTYVLASAPGDGNAFLNWTNFPGGAGGGPSTGNDCQATGGSLTITSYGGVGGKVEGTFSVTSDADLLNGGFPCPTPIPSGSFSITLDTVLTFGNDGKGIDTVDLTFDGVHAPGYPKTESTVPLNDPVLFASNFGPGGFQIALHSQDNRANGYYDHDFSFMLNATPGAGAYAEGTTMTTTLGGGYAVVCKALAASTQLVITSYAGVGGQVTGTFTIVDDGTSGLCPFITLTGTFAVTIEALSVF